MERKFLAFDIETAADIPGTDFNWKPHRPIGITCAAAIETDAAQPTIWHGRTVEGKPAHRMSAEEVRSIVQYLAGKVAEGFTILTWNGLGFDLDVLAEESGAVEACRHLALGHVDMMFHVFCEKGFPVGLERAAKALGISGKLEGMSGWQAPKLWAKGEHEKVIEYVGQDVRLALQVGVMSEDKKLFSWVTQKGTTSSLALKKGWLAVSDALKLPVPDTSWMTKPIPRTDFTGWLGKS